MEKNRGSMFTQFFHETNANLMYHGAMNRLCLAIPYVLSYTMGYYLFLQACTKELILIILYM
jgi:hypothetical protein